MDGVITQQDVVPSDEAGNSVLSIKGEDLTRMLDLIDLSGFPFPALPAEARVALMVAKYTPVYKILPLVMPSILIDIEDPLTNIPAQIGTDLTYIKLLADRVGLHLLPAAGPAAGRERRLLGAQAARRRSRSCPCRRRSRSTGTGAATSSRCSSPSTGSRRRSSSS